MDIRIKRVYDEPADDDGYRVLVDRLWPRGIRKADLVMDEWAKDLTPTTKLRQAWHGNDIDDEEFYRQYALQLQGNPELRAVRKRAGNRPITLLVATRNVETSHAHVLAKALQECC